MHPFPSRWACRRAALQAGLWEKGRPTGTGWRIAAVAAAFLALAGAAMALGTSPLVPLATGLMTVGFSLTTAAAVGVSPLRRRANARLETLFAAAVDVYAPFAQRPRTTRFVLTPKEDGRLVVSAVDHRWFATPEERSLPATDEEWTAFSYPVSGWLQDAVAAIVAGEGLDAGRFGHRTFAPPRMAAHGSRHGAIAAHARLQALLPPGVVPPTVRPPPPLP